MRLGLAASDSVKCHVYTGNSRLVKRPPLNQLSLQQVERCGTNRHV